MDEQRGKLRREVIKAALVEVERVGPAAFRVAKIAATFEACGVSRATTYRWVSTAIKTGRFGEQVARNYVDRTSKRTADRRREDAAMAAALPAPVTAADIAEYEPAEIMQKIQLAITTAQQVIQSAQNEDGTVRNAKLLLAASNSLRCSLQTAHNISESICKLQRVWTFHRLMVSEIAEESPACAERVMRHLERFVQGDAI